MVVGEAFEREFCSFPRDEEHAGVDDSFVDDFHGVQVVVERVSDKDGVGVEDAFEVLLHGCQVFRDVLESVLVDAGEVRVVVDDRVRRLDQRLVDGLVLKVDNRYAGEFVAGRSLDHLAVYAEHFPALGLVLEARPVLRAPVLFADGPAGVRVLVQPQLALRERVLAVLDVLRGLLVDRPVCFQRRVEALAPEGFLFTQSLRSPRSP